MKGVIGAAIKLFLNERLAYCLHISRFRKVARDVTVAIFDSSFS